MIIVQDAENNIQNHLTPCVGSTFVWELLNFKKKKIY